LDARVRTHVWYRIFVNKLSAYYTNCVQNKLDKDLLSQDQDQDYIC